MSMQMFWPISRASQLRRSSRDGLDLLLCGMSSPAFLLWSKGRKKDIIAWKGTSSRGRKNSYSMSLSDLLHEYDVVMEKKWGQQVFNQSQYDWMFYVLHTGHSLNSRSKPFVTFLFLNFRVNF